MFYELFIVTKSSSIFHFFTHDIVIHLLRYHKMPQEYYVVTDCNHNSSAERNTLALPTAVTSYASQHFNTPLHKIHRYFVILFTFFKVLIYTIYKIIRFQYKVQYSLLYRHLMSDQISSITFMAL